MGSCIFSYYISESGIETDELTNKHCFGKYTVYTDSKTPYISAGDANRQCVVFGLAVNVFTRESEGLAWKILSCCSGISDVIAFEQKLGGKYIILYREEEQYHILGDATGSIPVFYNTDGAFACASNAHYLAERCGYLPAPALQQIRDSGDISQAMPYDITQYREIKRLLPNHCLSVNTRAARRFINAARVQPALTAEEAANLAAPRIEAITDYYRSIFKLYCPLTAGRDSRAVLAFLAENDPSIQCYTIRHPEHRGDEQDLLIPKQLCSENGIAYEQIRDVEVPEALKEAMDCSLGKNQYSFRTLQIAETIRKHYGDGAIINGDIIGQVGKCSLHRDIPLCFASPGYFRCKLHNYSAGAKEQLRLWLREIQASGECVNAFDLFSIENRLGRWAAQENLIYNSVGQVYLNIFNSRSIIYTWTAVDRKERKRSRIHVSLINSKIPSLLAVPFESDECAVIRLSKANGLSYLLSSYAKYYIERVRFQRGKRHEKTDNNSR